MTTDQDLIFRDGEGDAWYQRNAKALANSDKPDPVLILIDQLDPALIVRIASVCDVGCANGWRLSRLKKRLPAASRLAGFDASRSAVEAGRAEWPQLDLQSGLIDEPPFAEQFDLVIVSFVLHWVNRQRLSRAIAAVDGLVASDGLLVIADFLPDRPCARRYHHRDDVALYTYKQDYPSVFTALQTYRNVAQLTFSHDHQGLRVGPAIDQDRAVVAVLHKQPDAYPVL